MRLLFWIILGRRMKAIPYMLRDKSVPLRKKLIIVAGFAFLFLPITFLPPIFVWGMLSKIIVWLWILLYLKDELDKYWVGEKPQDFSKKYKNKTVIDDVDFEVQDDRTDKDDENDTEKEEN